MRDCGSLKRLLCCMVVQTVHTKGTVSIFINLHKKQSDFNEFMNKLTKNTML